MGWKSGVRKELYDFQDGLRAFFHGGHAEQDAHGLGDTALAADNLDLVFIGDLETEDDAAILK